MPARVDIVRVVDALIQAPPTDDERRLVADIARDAEEQNLEPEQIEARLQGTRFLEMLHWLTAHHQAVGLWIGVLCAIISAVAGSISAAHDLRSDPPPAPPPAPPVNVTVNVDSGEIADRVLERLKREGQCDVPGRDAAPEPYVETGRTTETPR